MKPRPFRKCSKMNIERGVSLIKTYYFVLIYLFISFVLFGVLSAALKSTIEPFNYEALFGVFLFFQLTFITALLWRILQRLDKK